MKPCLALCLICFGLAVETALCDSGFLMEEMTWEEVEASIDSGTDTVIITIGATEQHGPQIALASDSITGDYLAPKIAERLGRTLIAPNIRVGVSPHHLYFPGTISARGDVIGRLVTEYVHSLVWHGFRHIAIIPTHGGNFTTVAEVGRKLSMLYPYVNIMAFADAEAYIGALTATSERLGVALDVAGSHAGMSETSMALAARPDLVRMNRASAGFMGDAYGAGEKMGLEGTKSVSPIGVLGDPTSATAEMGREYLDGLADLLSNYLQRRRSEWEPRRFEDVPHGGLADPEGELAEGVRARRSGDIAAAKAFFEARLEADPEHAEARVELARTHILIGDYARAAKIITPVLDGTNMRARALANDELAFISLYQGRFADAIRHKHTAREILAAHGGSAIDLARRYLQVGYIQTETGQLDAARGSFEKALQYVPDLSSFNLDIRHLAALVEVKQGRLHTADGTLRAIGDAVFQPGLGDQIRRFYQLDAVLRMALGRPQDALIGLPYAIEIYDHPLYRETQARAFLMLDRLEAAEETLLRLVNLTDARFDIPIVFVRAHYYLGTVYERQGRIQEATDMYSRFLEFWGTTEAPLIEVRNARDAVSRLAQSSQGS
jgi:creatinine amidohydrolase